MTRSSPSPAPRSAKASCSAVRSPGGRHVRRAGEDREAAFHPGRPGQRRAVRPRHATHTGTGSCTGRGRNGEACTASRLPSRATSSPGQQQPHRPPASRRAARPRSRRVGHLAERAELLPAVVAQARCRARTGRRTAGQRGHLAGQHHGRRRDSGVTMGPNRISLVAVATAAIVIQASATGTPGADEHVIPQEKAGPARPPRPRRPGPRPGPRSGELPERGNEKPEFHLSPPHL